MITEVKPFRKKINLKGRNATWIAPELICEIKFAEWTKSGHMRHPSFKGLRLDKLPAEVTKEKVVKPPKQKPRQRKKESFLK